MCKNNHKHKIILVLQNDGNCKKFLHKQFSTTSILFLLHLLLPQVSFTNAICSKLSDFGQLHLQLSRIISLIPPSVQEHLPKSPYSFSSLKKASSHSHLDIESGSSSSSATTTSGSNGVKSPSRPVNKKKGNTGSSMKEKKDVQQSLAREKSLSLGNVKRSLSGGDVNSILSTYSPHQEDFSLPHSVIILPVPRKGSPTTMSVRSSKDPTVAWETELLREEEVQYTIEFYYQFTI